MDEDLIYGVHAVLAALTESPALVADVWLDAQREDRRMGEVIAAARAARIKLQRVPRAKLEHLVPGARHQGVVARLQPTPAKDEHDLVAHIAALTSPALLLVLDGVQDPHNLGACLRTADAAGAQGVIIPRDAAAAVTATVRRIACGAAETVPVFQVTNLARSLKDLQTAGVWLVGTAGDAERDLYDIDLRGPVALVLGGEEAGMRRLTRERCDFVARLPLLGQVESLNVSVAAGVCLYEAVRQRRAAATPGPA